VPGLWLRTGLVCLIVVAGAVGEGMGRWCGKAGQGRHRRYVTQFVNCGPLTCTIYRMQLNFSLAPIIVPTRCNTSYTSSYRVFAP